MNAVPKQSQTLTVDEYLAFEATQEVRHEYVGGMTHAIVGGTQNHGRIVSNIHTALGIAAGANGPCEIFSQGTRLRFSHNTFYYPDVVMTCDPTDDARLYLERPSLIVEVLSESTASIDMREKLLVYHQIESLQTYLIVAQDEPQVLHHWRDDTGTWRLSHLLGFGTIAIPNLDAVLTLKGMYARVFDLQEP